MSIALSPLVSVVLPTYNHAHYLGHALKSVKDQTVVDWEVIVIDNHSQDNTEDIVLGFADSRIALKKIHNKGVIAASRNLGIRAARGEWIAFLDSDDCWYPNKLEVALAEIRQNPAIDVISTDELLVDQSSGKRSLLKYGPYHRDFYRQLLLAGNCLSPSSTLVRRDFLERNNLLFREDQEFVTAEDYDFWLLLARAGASFKFIHSVQGEYLIHASNNSSRAELHARNIGNVIRDHVFRMQSFQPDKDRLWRFVSARLILTSAMELLGRKEFIAGSARLFRSFRHSIRGSLWFLLVKIQTRLEACHCRRLL